VTILVDRRERASGVPEALRQRGLRVEWATLTAGDYVPATRTVVERKRFSDLSRTISTGCLWQQVGAMHAAFDRCYLIVEGCASTTAMVRAALLAVSDSGVGLLWSRNEKETAAWLHSLATRPTRGRRRTRRPSVSSPKLLLTSVRGISPAIAEDLLARYGSIVAIAQRPDAELLEVRGLGPSRVANLRKAFG
jgi:DNA excision repair protein ERCC-4